MALTNIVLPKKAGKKRNGGKTNRKMGRNRVKCEAYRRAGRREANKLRRAAKRARARARYIANVARRS